MDFVWIYAKPFSYFAKCGLWNELEYSIKSVKKNYKNATCWVIGDDPGMDVNHIYVDRIITDRTNHPTTMDVIRKFRTIIDSDIGDEFVLMYDDIFVLQPLTYDDLQITYGYNKINDVETYARKWSKQYKFLWRNTYRIIENIADEVYDWECHLPRLFDKYYFKEILDAYNCDEVPLIATSLYAAHFAQDTVLMDETIQFDLFQEGGVNYDEGFKRKFMNIMDDSITPEFKDKMTEVFGEGETFKRFKRH